MTLCTCYKLKLAMTILVIKFALVEPFTGSERKLNITQHWC